MLASIFLSEFVLKLFKIIWKEDNLSNVIVLNLLPNRISHDKGPNLLSRLKYREGSVRTVNKAVSGRAVGRVEQGDRGELNQSLSQSSATPRCQG